MRVSHRCVLVLLIGIVGVSTLYGQTSEWYLFVAHPHTTFDNPVQITRYDGTTGAFIDVFVEAGSGGGRNPMGIAFDPDGNLYVANELSNDILRYDGQTGAFIDAFIPSGSGGLSTPAFLAFRNNYLYVASRFSNEILRYDATTGAFVDVFVSGAELQSPFGLSFGFGPDENLYVTHEFANQVLRYNGTTGAFMGVFASGGGLNIPNAITFGPDGHLYVVSGANSQILRYHGTTGAFMGVFASGTPRPVDFFVGITFGPDGNLYVSNDTLPVGKVYRFNGTTGAFMDVFATSGAGGGHGLVFRRVITTVAIDIKPGASPNPINRQSNGSIPVAVLSSSTFDATAVDRRTVLFAGASPLNIGPVSEDVNQDGRPDVVFHFATRSLVLPDGTVEACLTGKTIAGQAIKGCDSVLLTR